MAIINEKALQMKKEIMLIWCVFVRASVAYV